MLKPPRTNPLLDQTLRAGRQPSPRVTLVLLIALLTGATIGQDWLNDHLPAEARAVLLLMLWLLPLVTMALAASSTARRLRSEGFQLVKQSPLTDRQVTWGLGLGTLYTLRVILVLAFGLLPALIDDTPLGGASTALCLAGLHLAASMLGTALVLRWGRQRLGLIVAIICCTLTVALLLAANALFLPAAPMPGCPPTSLMPADFRLSALLFRWGLRDLLAVASAIVMSFLLGLAASLIPWRGREIGWLPRLEAVGLMLAIGAIMRLWVIDAGQVEAKQRQALVSIYQETGGATWTNHSGWLSDQSVCTWYGIRCACGNIVQIELKNNNLHGQAPSEISQLTGLGYLDLSYNELTSLPPEIGQLTSLLVLELDYDHFTELPTEIGRLTNLKELYLWGNRLTALPPEIGRLNSLQHLKLSGNRLTALPPEIGQLTSLQVLDLSGNQLTTLPPEIGQLASLQQLCLGGNQLTELPPEIGRLASLHEILLYANRVTELPPEISQLNSLQFLGLSGNQLTTLPPEICQRFDLYIDIREQLCDE